MGIENALAGARAVEGEACERLGVWPWPEGLGSCFATATKVDRGPISAREEDFCGKRTGRAGEEQQCRDDYPHGFDPSERARLPEPRTFTALQALHCYWSG